MEMHQIRYFLSVAEELNFTRAAERCQVAQPSITRAIKILEDELGGALFHRERANTHLTELGRIMKPHLERIYLGAQNAKRQAQEFVQLKRTPLRLGLMDTVAPDWLFGIIETVLKRNPGLSLKIDDASPLELEGALLNGDLEVAVYSAPVTSCDERLRYLPLYREEFMVVLPKAHPLSNHSIVAMSELSEERYLSRKNCIFGARIEDIFEKQNRDREMIHQAKHDDWILAMVAAGLGVTVMPHLCIKHSGVVARPLSPECAREIALVTVRGRPQSPAASALVAEAKKLAPRFGKSCASGTRVSDTARNAPGLPEISNGMA